MQKCSSCNILVRPKSFMYQPLGLLKVYSCPHCGSHLFSDIALLAIGEDTSCEDKDLKRVLREDYTFTRPTYYETGNKYRLFRDRRLHYEVR